MKSKYIVFLIVSFLSVQFSFSQSLGKEIGAEIQAASFSNLGGTVGGSLKFAFVEEETLVFGPSIRYQYLWNKNVVEGTQGSASTFGGGGFLHYRFMDWFFVGSEVEVLQNPFNYIQPEKKWTLTAFLGGGISRDVNFVRLNFGIFYDVVDGLKDPLLSNPSPLRRSYFIKKQGTTTQPNQSAYLPIIYRITFFFSIG